jgi:hypothetical protein
MREILSTEIMPAWQYVSNKKYERRKIIFMQRLRPVIYDYVEYLKLITTDTNKTLEDTEI